MLERTRVESASVRRLVADRAWGRAGAVGGVQPSEAYILGATTLAPLLIRAPPLISRPFRSIAYAQRVANVLPW